MIIVAVSVDTELFESVQLYTGDHLEMADHVVVQLVTETVQLLHRWCELVHMYMYVQYQSISWMEGFGSEVDLQRK